MSITVTRDLLELNPVRNEIRYAVETDGMIGSPATQSVLRILFDAGDMPQNGDSLPFYLDPLSTGTPGDPSLVLIYFYNFVTGAASDGTQIEPYTSGPIEDWVNNYLIPVLMLNYTLYTYYDIAYYTDAGNHGVEFVAKETGPNDLLADPTGFAFIDYDVVIGANASLQEKFGVLTQVWSEDGTGSEVFLMRCEELYPPDDDGVVEIDVADVLRAYVQPRMPTPGMTTAVHMLDSYTHFFIRTAERYGDPALVQPMVQSDTVWAYLAGRNEVDRVNYPDWADQILPGDVVKFLTAWPNTSQTYGKTITPAQREFLCFVVPRIVGLTAIKVKANLYYEDGTSETGYVIDTISSPEFGEQYMAAVGIEARGLDLLHPTKVIQRYTVFLTRQNDTGLSETRYYALDNRHHQNYRQLHCFNSQGGTDTIPLLGERKNKPEVDVDRSKRITNRSENLVEARSNVSVLRTMSDSYVVGTLLCIKEELAAIKDLMGSERIVERVGSEHWPVVMVDDKGPEVDEADGQAPAVIKYEYALNHTAT